MKNKWIISIAAVSLSIFVALVICLNTYWFSRFSRGIKPTKSDIQVLIDSGMVYDHVVIFGVDGAGGYFDKMDTPGFDKVFKGDLDSSITYKAVSQYPTESGYNWTSMIHGVISNKHGIDNHISGEKKYTDTKYPSLFKAYSEAHPDDYMVSVVNWTNINYGIIEDGITNLTKIDAGTKQNIYPGLDVDTIVAKETIREITNNNPKIVFTHFDSVDAAGHATGTGQPQYIQAMQHVDNLIGTIYDACVDAGWKDNTLYICISDHGHEYSGGHGSNSEVVRNVVFAVAGGKGNVISGTPGYTVTQDMASVVMYALGVVQPKSWDGGVPRNMFKGL